MAEPADTPSEPRGGWTDEERAESSSSQPGVRWRALRASGLQPLPRAGHTAVAHSGAVFCFGGYNGTTHFSSTDMLLVANGAATWVPVPCTNATRARNLHSAVEHDGAMWVFGGVGVAEVKGGFWSSPQQQAVEYNSISRFDFTTRTWEDIAAIGIVPEARDGHTAVAHGEFMYVFGGSDDTRVFNDLARFRFESRACVVGSSMFVFGGYDGKRAFNDAYLLDLETLTWSAAPSRGASSPPSPRYGHTCVASGRTVFVFGGYGAGLGYRSDVHCYDVDTGIWSVVTPVDDANAGAPAPRRRHAAVLLGESLVVTWGACAPGAGVGGYLNDAWELSLSAASSVAGAASADVGGALQLASDMGRLLDAQDFADVTFTFEAPEERTLKAHRAVLSSRCEVFARQFTSGMREASTTEPSVTVSGFSYDAFAALLRFVYTGGIRPDVFEQGSAAAELLELADRYMLPRLKRRCEDELAAAVDTDNAASLLIVADKYRCARLRKEAMAYIARNHAAVIQTPAFRELPQPVLLELMSELSKYNS
eukprot:m51a1_g11903 hypothetical protein (537) ;mRNA; f:623166-624962